MKNTIKYDNNLNVLGPIIRMHREKLNLSQAKLSDKLLLLGIDITKNSIQKLECRNRVIKDYELAGLSKVLGFSIDELLKVFINTLK